MPVRRTYHQSPPVPYGNHLGEFVCWTAECPCSAVMVQWKKTSRQKSPPPFRCPSCAEPMTFFGFVHEELDLDE